VDGEAAGGAEDDERPAFHGLHGIRKRAHHGRAVDVQTPGVKLRSGPGLAAQQFCYVMGTDNSDLNWVSPWSIRYLHFIVWASLDEAISAVSFTLHTHFDIPGINFQALV
jgi:hypothetical protein